MTDLVNVFSSLVDNQGRIKIAGINDSVKELTDEEKAMYNTIQFDLVVLLTILNIDIIKRNILIYVSDRVTIFNILCFI